MRAGALLLTTLTGCLYVGSINQAPSATLEIVSAPPQLIKGQSLQLAGTMHDPEDGTNLQYEWQVSRTDGMPIARGCDYSIDDQSHDNGQLAAAVTFRRVGSYTITLEVWDHFQAAAPTTTSTVMVSVVDAPPAFSKATGQLRAVANTTPLCNTYTAGQPLPLTADADQAGDDVVGDPDAKQTPPLGCPSYDETLSYRWAIVSLPSNSHAVLGPKPSSDARKLGDLPCPPQPALGLQGAWVPGADDAPFAVCFYPDVGGTSAGETYQIALYVSDGTTEIRSDLFAADVRADLPPCLTGAAPQPASYVVDRSQPQQFLATGVVDDLDGFGSSSLTFAWSIWREQDPVWRVVPDWPWDAYTLDASSFSVGEKVRVRVQPIDRAGLRDQCSDDSLDVCTRDSCLLAGQACQAWVTWDLELR